MSSLRQPKPILPWWQLGLMIAGCAISIWWLVPGDAELIEDLIKDENYEKALERLVEVTPAKRKANPGYYQSIELKLTRIQIPYGASAHQYNDWWKLATETWRSTNYSTAIFAEMLPIIPRLPDPKNAWETATGQEPTIPPAQYKRLASRVSDAALAADQPGTSARLYALGHPEENRSEKENLELARRWQFAGNPQLALDALGNITSPDAIIRRIALLRALNRNQEAVALIRVKMLNDTNAIHDQIAVEELAEAALAAGIPREAIPEYQKFAEEHPHDLTIQRRLRDLMVSAGQIENALPIAKHIVSLSKNDPDDIRTLARLSEYAGKSSDAFDQWLKLARQTKDQGAIDRLFDLNPGLYRDADLAKLLRNLVPIAERPDYTLITAQIMQNLGFYLEAERYFADYLEIVPDDSAVATELATLHFEMFEYPEAEKWYRHASELRPDDVALRLAVANSVMLENRPDDAFNIYRQIVIDHPTDEVIEQYIRIAESMGRYRELADGLREQMRRKTAPNVSSYDKLAYTFARLNETALREQVLREGLRHFPNNASMRLSLAQILADRKEYRSAEHILAAMPERHSDLTAALLYLDILRLNNNTVGERKYLVTSFTPEIRENEALLKKEARAYEALQKLEIAERIRRKLLAADPNDHERVGELARVIMLQGKQKEAYTLLGPFLADPSPAILKLAAEISIVAGDYLSAEQYQLEFLKSIKAPRETDWGTLGDIRLSRGDKEGALRAYQTANRIMIAKLIKLGESTLTKEIIVLRAKSLSLDNRHYLLYLTARVNDAATAKRLAEDILQKNPSDRQTLLVLASMALEKRDAEETLRLARAYLSFYPDDYQGLYFLGTGHFLAREYAKANAVLRDLKRQQFRHKKYPFETDLAASAAASGDWYRAMLSYLELLRHHDLNDDLRSDVRLALDGIYREHGRRIELAADSSKLARASVWRYRSLHAAHISNRNWLEITYQRDQIELEAAPGLNVFSRNRDQVSARLTRFISKRWKGEVRLGDYEDGILGGVGLRYHFAQQREIAFEQTINERATDSLVLETLDGRESRSSLNVNWLIEADLSLNLRASTRSIHIGDEKLGRSNGVDLNIDHSLRRHGPYISVGYRSSIATFTAEPITRNLSQLAAPISDPIGGDPGRDSVISNLLSGHINRHGGGLLITDHIASAWKYSLTLGTDYDFELTSWGWNSGLTLSFFPRKSIELSMNTGYTSSATDSNAGSAASLTNFLLRFYY